MTLRWELLLILTVDDDWQALLVKHMKFIIVVDHKYICRIYMVRVLCIGSCKHGVGTNLCLMTSASPAVCDCGSYSI